MTRIRISAGAVEVDATGAKAETLAQLAASLWDYTQMPRRRSNWLLCKPCDGDGGEPEFHTAGPFTHDDEGTTE